MNFWMIIAAVLTLVVLSRLAGENPIFRLTQYLFVGISLGFSLLILGSQIIQIGQSTLTRDETSNLILTFIPIVFGLLLFVRLGSQRLSWLANLPLGILFGVAAGLAIGGAALGTVIPQVQATIVPVTPAADPAAQIGRWIVLPIGIILVLLSFTYTGKQVSRGAIIWRLTGGAGRLLLITSLGVFFAGAMLSYLTALVERISFLASLIR